ncbi:FAD binding domain-containing protein [Arthrobacter psychrochitiniphilus]|uniref:Uncharacterized protein n=1 Tax=Arthrobacter psychrochitiniphilus TaxID=291045 RepID=A0A2V3DU81_9MICC|nr:carbon-monoxide dehydrogenase medium subunit [Arthrobacter psychrochitiniphilus]PXA64118.1 hypothetical protein CVS29_16590 [Arthrobacter psychrochitiniphilus]
MKLPPLSYQRPTDLREASLMLGSESMPAVLAGGQSIIPALRFGERSESSLVDISRLAELQGITHADGFLRIGAGVPMWEVCGSPEVATSAPLLIRVLGSVGAVGIRSRATLGGSLAWADSTSQLPSTLIVLNAQVETTERILDAADLQIGQHQTVLRRGELIVSIQIPEVELTGSGFHLIRKTHITWPVVGAVAVREPSGQLRLVVFGAAPTPILAVGADRAKLLSQLSSRILPFDDERARAGYRGQVAPILAGRALDEAIGSNT